MTPRTQILDYIDKDIEEHPEHLIKPDPEMLAELDELVDGIEIDDLPEDVILAALKAAHAFIDAMMSFYGTNLEVANWHLNGDTVCFYSFFQIKFFVQGLRYLLLLIFLNPHLSLQMQTIK